MIRILFATLYMTIALLFAFQVKSELSDPVVLGLVLLIVGLSGWHVRRVSRGLYTSPFSRS